MKKTPEEAAQVERCPTGKKKSTYSQAKREAKFLKHHKKLPHIRPNIYKCKECNWWHVGNTE